MKDNQKVSDDTDDQKRIQENFESLPLNEKLSSLFKMEVVTITEAVNYVIRDPMKVAERFGDFITDLGSKVEKEFRDATATYSGESTKQDTGGAAKKTRTKGATGPNSPSI